ncbi:MULTISPECIES: hypothetical protein [unclassified Helicobacter]|uniref:hypothetical protein n=1 Tax=unclassified Helicobacter TaxID=2593540 RepID=UPI0009ED11EB|nr:MULTISPECIES: hypothetical protein [unclassified Helicobacter]
MDVKTWIFPTICFVLFCYAMVFVGIFTYHINPNVSLFQSGSQGQKGTTDIEGFQRELNRVVK